MGGDLTSNFRLSVELQTVYVTSAAASRHFLYLRKIWDEEAAMPRTNQRVVLGLFVFETCVCV